MAVKGAYTAGIILFVTLIAFLVWFDRWDGEWLCVCGGG